MSSVVFLYQFVTFSWHYNAIAVPMVPILRHHSSGVTTLLQEKLVFVYGYPVFDFKGYSFFNRHGILITLVVSEILKLGFIQLAACC